MVSTESPTKGALHRGPPPGTPLGVKTGGPPQRGPHRDILPGNPPGFPTCGPSTGSPRGPVTVGPNGGKTGVTPWGIRHWVFPTGNPDIGIPPGSPVKGPRQGHPPGVAHPLSHARGPPPGVTQREDKPAVHHRDSCNGGPNRGTKTGGASQRYPTPRSLTGDPHSGYIWGPGGVQRRPHRGPKRVPLEG